MPKPCVTGHALRVRTTPRAGIWGRSELEGNIPGGTVTRKFAATALGTSGGSGDAPVCAVYQPLAGMNRGPVMGVFAR
jgi:hypothetical protein